MSAREDFDAILQAVDTLKKDMNDIYENFSNIRISLQESIDSLDDIGVSSCNIYPILQDLDNACEVELVDVVKKFYREIS